MGLQLIFVVETNKKCNSDWIYIKDTIDRFFDYNNSHIKLTTVYMNGKGNYFSKEKEIQKLINMYGPAKAGNKSQVIYCFDCDDYDSKSSDLEFLQKVEKYCKDKRYEFSWFCKDIERVYLGRKVADNSKKKEAVQFKKDKKINDVNERNLSCKNYKNNTSNIICVLDKYLERKTNR